ncbi:MAG: ComEA family DNA-binding protein [Candidatus Hodarchaeales archaeon]|jgi:competence ComEA-like helix-hairpin-helix protein
MANDKISRCQQLTEEVMAHLQSLKYGEISAAIRKLSLIAELMDKENLSRWCDFHLGKYSHIIPPAEKVDQTYVNNVKEQVKKLKIGLLSTQEILCRLGMAGGGFESVEFIERTLEEFQRRKINNNGIHYISDLKRNLGAIANGAYEIASYIYKTYSFGDIPQQQFNFIREKVDGLLMDICPDAIEKFMIAYEKLASRGAENWSLALTECRRILKAVADSIFPAQSTKKGERKLGDDQYINRLWAFMDQNIRGGSDKDLTKAHIDYLGSFLEEINKKASKGVHATVTREEAIRAVLYTYLTIGDILEFGGKAVKKALSATGKIDINSASIVELKKIPGITSEIAKKIIKLRSKSKFSAINELKSIEGIGPKKLEKISEMAIVI